MVESWDSDVGEGEDEAFEIFSYDGLDGQGLETLPEANAVETIAMI